MPFYCSNLTDLGGGPATLFTDLEQVEKMRFLRIKIDVATRGLPESKREIVRNHLRDIYCQVPTRRLWMYLKMLREMSLDSSGAAKKPPYNKTMYGPEDAIVKGEISTSNR